MKKYLIILSLLALGNMALAQDYFGAGNDSGLNITSSSNSRGTDAGNTVNGSGMDADIMAMSRFLDQATMGSSRADIEAATLLGYEAWIKRQYEMDISRIQPRIENIWGEMFPWQYARDLKGWKESNPDIPLTAEIEKNIEEDVFGPWAVHFFYGWWENTILAEDQLRQRVAYALSQIIVVSANSDLRDHAESMSSYYDLLLTHAFGNYRDLLMDMTLNPSMGLYLSHYNNPKEVLEEKLHPDENYAREIMQLFSIGLFELNLDGSRKKDVDGSDIPTYNNDDVKEVAKVFTGLAASGVMENPYVEIPYFGMNWYLADKEKPMTMYEEWHDEGIKKILGDLELPAGQSGMQDIEETIDFLFNHDNTGPFVVRQLIQRLVKSNPSPGYISRVASRFNDNGSGVRGDMKSVITAILMDEEARNCDELQSADNGHLREPILRLTKLAKSFDLNCIKDTLILLPSGEYKEEKVPCQKARYWHNGITDGRQLRQTPVGAPSVFNFYLPDHSPVGGISQAGLVAPEFKIHDATTSINYINQVHGAAFWDFFLFPFDRDLNEDMGVSTIDFVVLTEVAKSHEELLNYLDVQLTHGQLSESTRTNLRDFLDNMPNWINDDYKARVILFMIMISPDFAIMK